MHNTSNAGIPTGMAHVERRELYEDLHARLQYLKAFLEFDQGERSRDQSMNPILTFKDDIKVLNDCRPQIKAMIPTLSDNHFFTKLLKQDITAQALITRNTTEETYLDEDDFYGPESKNIRNRNMVLWNLPTVKIRPANQMR